eukprot:151821_1
MSSHSPILYTKRYHRKKHCVTQTPLTPTQFLSSNATTPQSPTYSNTYINSYADSSSSNNNNNSNLNNSPDTAYIWNGQFTNLHTINTSITNYDSLFPCISKKHCHLQNNIDHCFKFCHKYYTFPNVKTEPRFYHCHQCVYIVFDIILQTPSTMLHKTLTQLQYHQMIDIINLVSLCDKNQKK